MWHETLEEVARAAGLPFGVRAASEVRALSDAYNEGRGHAGVKGSLAARLAFFFARDLPKSRTATRELPSPVRVLDLGAGLGAATFGLDRVTHATLVDRDEEALALARAIAKKRGVDVKTIAADVQKFEAHDFDLVIAMDVLTEIRGTPERDADLLQRWLSFAKKDGALVVIEPALRTATRHLHEVRDLLVRRDTNVFAPCLHARGCPMLANPKDWCHEDLPIDLPDWLVPLARAAGLRWQGLTYSRLVLRRDERKISPDAFRVVSKLVRTKGKVEAHLCGPKDGVAMRLDRDETAENDTFSTIERGDVVTLDPITETLRIGKTTRVARVLIDGDTDRE